MRRFMVDMGSITGMTEEEIKYTLAVMMDKANVFLKNEKGFMRSGFEDVCLDFMAVKRNPAILKYMNHYVDSTSATYLRASQGGKNE